MSFMNYKEMLNLFSTNVLSLETSNESCEGIIEKDIENMRIYKRNYLQLCFSNFSNDFPATKSYVGKNNFLFFTRSFLLDKGLGSVNIFKSSESFLFYLKGLDAAKEDRLIFELALIDFLWAYAKLKEIKVTDGVLEYWQELTSKKKTKKKIDFTKLVKIKLVEIDNERAFKLCDL